MFCQTRLPPNFKVSVCLRENYQQSEFQWIILRPQHGRWELIFLFPGSIRVPRWLLGGAMDKGSFLPAALLGSLLRYLCPLPATFTLTGPFRSTVTTGTRLRSLSWCSDLVSDLKTSPSLSLNWFRAGLERACLVLTIHAQRWCPANS